MGKYTMYRDELADGLLLPTFYSAGNELTVLVDVENLGHETYPFVAAEAWQFLKQFSRSADGQILINGKAAATPEPEPTEPETTSYVVVKGDTLWGIAARYLGRGSRWRSIYEANRDLIKNPNRIYVGQVLEIPNLK